MRFKRRKELFNLLHLHRRRENQENGWRGNLRKAQSMVEIAIIFPVLLIVLTGLIEFGFLLNDYLTILDAARNAARFSADSNYLTADASNYCDSHPSNPAKQGTTDFYKQTACLVCIELANEKPAINGGLNDGGTEGPLLTNNVNWVVPSTELFNCPLDSSQDEVLVSAISVQGDAVSPTALVLPGSPWSLYNQGLTPKVNSSFVQSQYLNNTPNAGFIAVEVVYHYKHVLGLPWIGAFLGDPTALHVYTIMPLASGEPTSTPVP